MLVEVYSFKNLQNKCSFDSFAFSNASHLPVHCSHCSHPGKHDQPTQLHLWSCKRRPGHTRGLSLTNKVQKVGRRKYTAELSAPHRPVTNHGAIKSRKLTFAMLLKSFALECCATSEGASSVDVAWAKNRVGWVDCSKITYVNEWWVECEDDSSLKTHENPIRTYFVKFGS